MGQFGPADRHSTRRDPAIGRIKVDVANTAFWESKEYRISKEILGLDSTPLVLKVVSVGDFILQKQELTCDAGGIRFSAYRAGQGTEGGTFTAEQVYSVNFMDSTGGVIPPTVTISSGGTFTPNSDPVEVLRVVTSNSTSQQSTVTGAVGDERGLPAGTYYLVFENIAQSGSSNGTYSLKWEER
jgi:hypothetical protein